MKTFRIMFRTSAGEFIKSESSIVSSRTFADENLAKVYCSGLNDAPHNVAGSLFGPGDYVVVDGREIEI